MNENEGFHFILVVWGDDVSEFMYVYTKMHKARSGSTLKFTVEYKQNTESYQNCVITRYSKL